MDQKAVQTWSKNKAEKKMRKNKLRRLFWGGPAECASAGGGFRRGTKTSKGWQIRAKGSGQELGEGWAGQGTRHWEFGTPSLQAGAADRFAHSAGPSVYEQRRRLADDRHTVVDPGAKGLFLITYFITPLDYCCFSMPMSSQPGSNKRLTIVPERTENQASKHPFAEWLASVASS